MKSLAWMTCSLLLFSGALVAAEENSKTIDRPEGALTIKWGEAPPQPSQGAPDFDALDSNGDGQLSLAETEPHRLLHSDFIYADSNRNGSISRAELERWH